jgi:nitroreductase
VEVCFKLKMESLLKEIKNRKSVSFFKDKDVEKEKIQALIEAAKWAPSSFNNQPWNYIFVGKKDKTRKELEKALAITNGWAKKAPYLIVVAADPKDDTTYNGIEYYLYDCGLSVMNLSIEAEYLGLATHQMAGWKGEKVRQAINLPENMNPVVLIALGYEEDPKKIGIFSKLTEKMKQKVIRQRTRKKSEENFFFGEFGKIE